MGGAGMSNKIKKKADSKKASVMAPEAFRAWRKSLRLSQKEAAAALGLKRRIVQYYEKGERDGVRIEVPRTVRLACFALAQGVKDYPGPESRAKATDGEPQADEPSAPAE